MICLEKRFTRELGIAVSPVVALLPVTSFSRKIPYQAERLTIGAIES